MQENLKTKSEDTPQTWICHLTKFFSLTSYKLKRDFSSTMCTENVQVGFWTGTEEKLLEEVSESRI